MKNKPVLKASSYYLEDALGLRLDERAKEGKITFLLLNQPPVCDAHCRRCFMPNERRKLGNKNALALDESKRVLEQAREHGALCLEISGEGEPVLSKNLQEIIEYANRVGYLITLITNGHNLTREQIAFYRNSNVTLVFSHYSLNKERYEADNDTCGKGSFERKGRNLESAVEIFQDTIERKEGFDIYRLGIHATLQADNIQDALDIKKYCREKGIFFSIAPLAQTGCAIEHPELKLERKVEVDGKGVPLFDVPNLLGDNSIIHSHSSAREIGKEVCGTCFYGLNVGYDGAVLFDAHTGYEIGNMLGNIKTDNFSEIIRRQRKMSKLLFSNIDGFCPVRDEKWHYFLRKFIKGEITL